MTNFTLLLSYDDIINYNKFLRFPLKYLLFHCLRFIMIIIMASINAGNVDIINYKYIFCKNFFKSIQNK